MPRERDTNWMNEFNTRLVALAPDAQSRLYQDLAEAALSHYDLAVSVPQFLQHNSGISYHLPVSAAGCSYLLKINVPIGTSDAPDVAHLEAICAWLAALDQDTHLAVPAPIANHAGQWVTLLPVAGLAVPLPVTVQHWLEGEIVTDDLSLEQAGAIGGLLAQLHTHSSRWLRPIDFRAPVYNAAQIAAALAGLAGVVAAGILTADDFATLTAAAGRLSERVLALSHRPAEWGLVHGDLHQGNLVWIAGRPQPIDFGAMLLAPYYYDLGVALYHLQYRGPNVCAALIAGYQNLRPLPSDAGVIIEAFVLGAALANLAFQHTIPAQRTSTLFARNVRDLTRFSRSLLTGTSFVLA